MTSTPPPHHGTPAPARGPLMEMLTRGLTLAECALAMEAMASSGIEGIGAPRTAAEWDELCKAIIKARKRNRKR